MLTYVMWYKGKGEIHHIIYHEGTLGG